MAVRPAATEDRSNAVAPAGYSMAMLFWSMTTPPREADSTSMGLLAVTLRYRVAPGDATVPTVPSPRSLHQLTAVVRATAGGSRHPPSGSEAPSAGVPGAQHSPPYRA